MKPNRLTPVKVKVHAEFLPECSAPDEEQYVFACTISIKNNSNEVTRLLHRHWFITDANGQMQEVFGESISGEQPEIEPGDSYEYTSGIMLPTPIGSIEGSYHIELDNGQQFFAPVKSFPLVMRRKLH